MKLPEQSFCDIWRFRAMLYVIEQFCSWLHRTFITFLFPSPLSLSRLANIIYNVVAKWVDKFIDVVWDCLKIAYNTSLWRFCES